MKLYISAELAYMTKHYDYYFDIYDDDGSLIENYSFDSWVATRPNDVRNFYSFSKHWIAWVADIAGDRIKPDETIEIIDMIQAVSEKTTHNLSLPEFLKSHTICYQYNDIIII